jgi:hypothetical protein
MDEMQTNNELSNWFSTYGVITAERILGTYNISIPHSELVIAIKSPSSFYHQLLQVPLRNVLNGIVLQQANDYHIYSQKLFIDYLLSGESAKGEEAQGAHTREALENERTQLVTLGEEFHKEQLEHDALIASSQSNLIKIVKAWKVALESGIRLSNRTLNNNGFEIKKNTTRQAVNHALIHSDLVNSQSAESGTIFVEKFNDVIKVQLTTEIKEQLLKNFSDLLELTMNFHSKITSFNERATLLSEQSQSFRTQFYQTILRVTELISLLPDYKINSEQDAINREPLHFDKTIGERL